MKAIALSLLAFGTFSAAASAAPTKLNKAQMDQVVASQGGQQNFAPGQFPAGNPAQAPGRSNPTPPR